MPKTRFAAQLRDHCSRQWALVVSAADALLSAQSLALTGARRARAVRLIEIKDNWRIAHNFIKQKRKLEEWMMDKDRVIGSAKVVKGKIKEAVGKAVGDAKLESEGKADKFEGKVQNAVGGIKDVIKEK